MPRGRPKKQRVDERVIQSGEYSIVFETIFNKIKLVGDSIFSILGTIKPETIRGKAFVVVSKGKFKSEMILYPRQLKRIMDNNTYRSIVAKRLETMLK